MSEVTLNRTEHLAGHQDMTFILCEHTPENYAAIIESLNVSSPSIVAIETLGGNQASRDASEATVNAYITGEAAIGQSGLPGFDGMLAQHLKGTDTIVRYVDASDGTPEYAAVQTAKRNRLAYRAIVSDPEANELITNLARQSYRDAFLRANAAREMLVARQVAHLQAEYSDRHVNVILGAVHTAVAEKFTASDPELKFIQGGQVVESPMYSDELKHILQN